MTSLPHKKRGQPFLLGESVDKQLQLYLKKVRDSGGIIIASVVVAAAHGMILSGQRLQLAEFGGHVQLSRRWYTDEVMKQLNGIEDIESAEIQPVDLCFAIKVLSAHWLVEMGQYLADNLLRRAGISSALDGCEKEELAEEDSEDSVSEDSCCEDTDDCDSDDSDWTTVHVPF